LGSYRIFETEQFQNDLTILAKSGRSKIIKKLYEFVYPQLRNHPNFGPHIKKLKDFQPDTWRYRIGSWRFFYQINETDRIVFMLAAHHRSSAY